jgi:hypothetical protein
LWFWYFGKEIHEQDLMGFIIFGPKMLDILNFKWFLSLKIQQKSKMWMENELGCNIDIAFGFYSKSKLQINKYEITL